MKTSKQNNYVGIDISKDTLDVHCHSFKKVRSFPNSAPGLKKLFQAIPQDSQLVCEPTGGYEKPLLKKAHLLQIPISMVNPRQARDFARAKGLLAKTDAIDASVLTEYGEVFSPQALKPASAIQEQLSAAVRRKDVLTKQLIAEKTALTKESNSFVRRNVKSSITHLTKLIERCEVEIQNLIDSDDDLAEKQRKLQQIKGVGLGACSIVIAEFPELGNISNKQAASLAGVAPFNRDSGKWRGTRSIQGGRSLVRRGLYMPALSASRHNPILRDLYRNLRREK